MNRLKYNLKYNTPRNILSFIVSSGICILFLGRSFFVTYAYIPVNSISPHLFISDVMFILYIRTMILFFIQATLFSLINCIIDLVFLETDYQNTPMCINGEKITKEQFTKQILLKHIPIFSVINALFYLFVGATIVEKTMKITYSFESTNQLSEEYQKRFFRIIVIFILIQFIASFVAYQTDIENSFEKQIGKENGVTGISIEFISGGNNDFVQIEYIVDIDSSGINYNRIENLRDTIYESFGDAVTKINSKYSKRYPEYQYVYSVKIVDSNTHTWDKILVDANVNTKYSLEAVSTDIDDVNPRINSTKLVYDIVYNSNEEKLSWDVAEYIYSVFGAAIEDEQQISIIKKIYGNPEVDVKAIKITNWDYNSDSNYFIIAKADGYDNILYFDKKVLKITDTEESFVGLIMDEYPNVDVNFKKLYSDGEIVIKTDDEVSIDTLNKLLETDTGIKLKEQTKIFGKSDEISFVVKENKQN